MDKRKYLKQLKYLQKLFYPQRCVCCDTLLGRKENGCCPACAAKLPRIIAPACMKCGKPVVSGGEEYCDDCRKYVHKFERGVAAFTYTGSLRGSVYRMKTQNRRDYLEFFGQEMVRALQPVLRMWNPQLLVPVPMHPKKKRRRGYNQAELLAEEIHRLTGIPVERSLVRCIRQNTDQKTLDRRKRKKNLEGSFLAVRNLPEEVVRVLIVDDVYTTGSTVDEIAAVLRRAGAKKIFFVVLCTGKGKKTVCTEKKLCYNEG